MPHGKSFDEMIAEKKKMREEVLGAVKTLSTKQSNASNKKKPKKEVKKVRKSLESSLNRSNYLLIKLFSTERYAIQDHQGINQQ